MHFLENFGLDVLVKEKEDAMLLAKDIFHTGTPIFGYYGIPYYNKHYGWVQCILRTKVDEAAREVDILGFDTHLSGVTHWELSIHSYMNNSEQGDPLTKCVLATNAQGDNGMAPIQLVNADVLPSVLTGDRITAQMVGFPTSIDYFKNEDDYIAAQPVMEDGARLTLDNGVIVPVGLLADDEKQTLAEKNTVLIRGTVKKIQPGWVKLGETSAWSYLDIIISTSFGDLEIVHTLEQVAEEQRPLIEVGAIVCGLFILSGDVAIGKYKDGFVLDQMTNLALMRQVLQSGEAERLRCALSEDAEYVSEASKRTFSGKQEIIERLRYVHEAHQEDEVYAFHAVISDVEEGAEELPYLVGTPCIVIVMFGKGRYESICFVECDEHNHISRFVVSENSRYHYRIVEEYPL